MYGILTYIHHKTEPNEGKCFPHMEHVGMEHGHFSSFFICSSEFTPLKPTSHLCLWLLRLSRLTVRSRATLVDVFFCGDIAIGAQQKIRRDFFWDSHKGIMSIFPKKTETPDHNMFRFPWVSFQTNGHCEHKIPSLCQLDSQKRLLGVWRTS